MTSREAAEEALRQRDWSTAFDYLAELTRDGASPVDLVDYTRDCPVRDEWLSAIESAALVHARAGDLQAQQVLGSVGITRSLYGSEPDLEALRGGLRWIVIALRQQLVDRGLDELVYWYGHLTAKGVRDAEIEAFLGEAEPRERYRRLRGSDPLPK
jgi:hypothetical protein